MIDLFAWASERWDARTAEPDLAIRSETLGVALLSHSAADLDRRRIDLHVALANLGADPALLTELEAYEASAGVVGVIIGVNHASEFDVLSVEEESGS